MHVGACLFSRAASSQVSSTQVGLTAVFGMGTGVPPPPSAPTIGDRTRQNSPTYEKPLRDFSNLSRPPLEEAALLVNGAPSGTRTRDTLIKSQVLYQLS